MWKSRFLSQRQSPTVTLLTLGQQRGQVQEAVGTQHKRRGAQVLQSLYAGHLLGMSRNLDAVNDLHKRFVFRRVRKCLSEKAAGRFLVVDMGLVEQAVVGSPIVVGKAEGDESLGYCTTGETKGMPQDESPYSAEDALLTKSGGDGTGANARVPPAGAALLEWPGRRYACTTWFPL